VGYEIKPGELRGVDAKAKVPVVVSGTVGEVEDVGERRALPFKTSWPNSVARKACNITQDISPNPIKENYSLIYAPLKFDHFARLKMVT